ncbi:MAG: hypothetical protein ACAH80_10985 [Alphaproteobacteria bacterium]
MKKFLLALVAALFALQSFAACAETGPKDEEYLKLVDAAMADPAKADWAKLRETYIDTGFYYSHNGFGFPIDAGTAVDKAAADPTPENVAKAKEVLRQHYACMGAHFAALKAHEKSKATFINPEAEKTAIKGLVDAFRATGDGRSMKTAFKAITIEEQHVLMQSYYGLKFNRKTLEQGNGRMYDVFQFPNQGDNVVPEMFFDITARFQRLDKGPMGELERKLAAAGKTAKLASASPAPSAPPVKPEDAAYLKLVEAAMKDSDAADWDGIRAQFASSSYYKAVGGTRLASNGRDAVFYVARRETPEAIELFTQIQKNFFGSMAMHSYALNLYDAKKPVYINGDLEKAAFKGLLDSLARSGEGTAEKPYRPISLEEATYYASLRYKPTDKNIHELVEGQLQITFGVTDPDGKNPRDLVFRLDPRATEGLNLDKLKVGPIRQDSQKKPEKP